MLPRIDRQLQGVRERDDARHLDGRLDQHRAASARRRARGGDRFHHGRHRPAFAPRAGAVQGRALGRRRACRGRAPRRRHHRHPRRTRPRRAAQPRRRDGACALARTRAVAQRHQAHRQQRDARILRRRAGRRADAGRLQPGLALRGARRGPREGRHPRRRARLLQGRRPRGALRQYRARRLHREDRGRRREHPQVRGAGEDLREPGRRGRSASSTAASSPATSW